MKKDLSGKKGITLVTNNLKLCSIFPKHIIRVAYFKFTTENPFV